MLSVVGLLAGLIGICLIYPAALVPVAGFFTESLLGRSLTVGGPVELDLSLQPRITVHEARFGNAQWSAEPHMVSADYLMVQIDLGDLFANRLHILDLDARGATLLLEDRVDGRPNWEFFEEEDDSEGADWSFVIRGLELTDCQVLARIGELQPANLQIPSLVESTDPEGHLHLTGTGTLNERAWQLAGRIGPLEEILEAGRIELDLDLTLDDARIVATGIIGNLTPLENLDLSLSASGPDADTLGELLNAPEAFSDTVALQAVIAPADGGHRLTVAGQVSAFEVGAVGTVADLENLDGWDLTVDITGPDAGIFGTALQITGFPDGPFEIHGQLHMHGGDLDLTEVDVRTEDATLTLNADFADFPRREGAFGSFRVAGPDISQFRTLLQMPALPVAPFTLDLSLDAQGNRVSSRLEIGSHRLEAEGILGEYPSFTETRLTTGISGGDQASAVLSLDDSGLTLSDIDSSTGPFQLTGSSRLPDLQRPGSFSVSATLAISDLADAGDRLSVAGLPAEPLRLEADLQSDEGVFSLTRSAMEFRNVHVTASGKLGELPGLTGVDLHIDLEGPDIGELFEEALEDPDAGIPFTLSTRVRGEEDAVELIGLQLEGQGGSFNLDGRLAMTEQFTGSHLTVSGRGPNLAALLPRFPGYTPPSQAWQIDGRIRFPDGNHVNLEHASIKVGSATLEARGLLSQLDGITTNLTLQASGDSFADLGQLGEVELPHIPFDLNVELGGTRTELNVTRFDLLWGDSDLVATGVVSRVDKPSVVLHGRSRTLNLSDLQKAIFGELEDQEPADDSTRVFADAPISLSELDEFNLDLDIEADQFVGRRARLDDVMLKLKVLDGALYLERVAFRDNYGHFDASAELHPAGEGVNLAAQITGTDADLGILTNDDQPADTIPRYTMDIALTGNGTTVADMAAHLNGRILISSDGGQIDNAVLDAFTGDFLSNVLDVLNPFVKSEKFTRMECMVVNARIDDGTLTLEPGFVMRTDRVNMFVFGKANLETERLDLSLASQARRGIGISAATITNPYFKVGGTLAAPALQLDPTSAAVAASVATATAGLSIIIRGVWDRLRGERNPCPEFLNYEHES
jgi:uncharacterized protein involved in outer membrane biogenesis